MYIAGQGGVWEEALRGNKIERGRRRKKIKQKTKKRGGGVEGGGYRKET